jgi:hypothetical protein
LLAAAACAPSPVAWRDPVRLSPAAVVAAGPDWRLALGAQGAAPVVRGVPLHAPGAAGGCPGSVVVAHERARDWHAAWFTARADSSVALLVSRTADDGATWSPAIAADARDQGRRGCARPAPAITADSTNGYVHVVYWIEAPGGGGEWLVHSMDHGVMWHPPMPLAFGGDPAAADVAAQGDTVAVAFESPNAAEGWIDLALSTTAGHIIDARLVAVSGRSVAVHGPRVALRGRTVAVAWVTDDGALAMARTGERR